jgi:4Fe-4S ferredoxin
MSKNPMKVKRAAADPNRPGEACKADPGAYRPEVDPRRCEGKGDCIEVCPYDVFELGRLPDATFDSMPFLARMKSRAHGRKTVFTPKSDACRACGLCVVACPERALRLVETAIG